ncbi:MAG: acetyltransferase [Mariprofundaceae bacterium]|nr:acetyltransferase [Mariprofundaceae bacterium]
MARRVSDLFIIGAGGHGKVVAETAEATGDWESILFLDDDFLRLNGSMRWPVANPDEFSDKLKDASAVIAIGNSGKRLALLDEVSAAGCMLPVLRHPAAWISPSAVFEEGAVVFAGAVIQAETRLGRGVIINTLAGVDHDCVLGDGVHICPGAHLAGNVTVGEKSWLGIGCSIKQGIRVGRNVTIGAGAVVINDVADSLTVVGCPARPVGADE